LAPVGNPLPRQKEGETLPRRQTGETLPRRQTGETLILVTNDDGIASPGLMAVARCVIDLGEVWIVAPRVQQSGVSRSFPGRTFRVEESLIEVAGVPVRSIALDTSPADVVRNAILRLLPTRPSLVVSGINFGENLGGSITISGTIAATIEAASFGIPALAASLETDRKYHFSHSDQVDFAAAAHFVRRFSRWLLQHGMPKGVDILKLDMPSDTRVDTPWKVTRLSRQQYWVNAVTLDEQGQRQLSQYERQIDLDSLEPDSDIHALAVDRVVSITPLTLDLTAKVSLSRLEQTLGTGNADVG
jgi:5'-nucleotidase